ncbi:MAG: T9SS type A sorting domain-containing protein [Bacteroidetes bacterium]|nr:T9SS type A sorting domain-containing protein [Bacteroidota bacterium]
MYRILITLIVLLVGCGLLPFSPEANAQKPQYYRDCAQGFSGGFKINTFGDPPAFYDSTPRKIQNIYTVRHFYPKVPKGNISAVYLRSGNSPFATRSPGAPPRIGYAYNVSISLGWTTRDTFRMIDGLHRSTVDTFIPEGTLIFKSEVIRQNLEDSGGVWMRFPVNQNAFLFDSSQGLNLVVTFKFGPPWVDGYFIIMDSCSGPPQTRIYGYDTTNYVTYGPVGFREIGTWGNADFGFDINPLGVSPGSFAGSFSVYPNPAKEGVNINLEGQKTINDLSISVRSLSGQTVFYTQFLPKSSHFSKYLSLPNVAKGMYFVEIEADGERAVQRVLLE